MPEEAPKGWRHWSRPAKPKKPATPVLVRYTAESGEVWTVWDTSFHQFKHHRRPHCDPDATARVFVNAAGVKRAYVFKRRDSRVLDTEELARQLRESAHVGEMPDVRNRTPR